jgi:mRNA interferase HigB
MHVISRKKLVQFWTVYGDAELALSAWFKVAELADWKQWSDVQSVYPKASYYRCCFIFDICGGDYRLVVRRSGNWKTLFVVGVLTHAEYDRNKWKKSCVRC